jgi:hypothetical protein
MKTNAKSMIAAMLVLSTAFIGCEKEAFIPLNGKKPAETSQNALKQSLDFPLEENLMQGRWKVVSFSSDGYYGAENAGAYVGYVFKFLRGNTVLVHNDQLGGTGRWRVYDDRGQIKIAFNFGMPELIALNDGWTQIGFGPNLVRLQKTVNRETIHLDLQQLDQQPK